MAADDLENARKENRLLAAQVRRLVQSEADLQGSQARLSDQIRIFRQLYESGKLFGKSFDVFTILSLIPPFVRAVLGFERCLVYWTAGQAGGFELRASAGYPPPDPLLQDAGPHRRLESESVRRALDGADFALYESGADAPEARHCALLFAVDECAVFALGPEGETTQGLVVAGNTLAFATEQNRVVSESDVVIGLANLVSLATTAIASAQSYQALQHERTLLEIRVEERTQELSQANQAINLLNERLASENVRLNAELDVARRLQQMILPREHELREIEGLDIATTMQPAAEVGGDYYDVLQKADGSALIGIGDVTGHGLESGVLMLMVQTAVRTLATCGIADAAQFLDLLNRTIYGNLQRMGVRRSLSLSLLNYRDGVLRVSGQHESVLVIRRTDSERQVEVVDTMDLGFPIGLVPDIADFVSHLDIALEPRDVLVLYSDGIPEAEDTGKAHYGLERLVRVVQTNAYRGAQQILEAVMTDVLTYIGEQRVLDDITLLVLKKR